MERRKEGVQGVVQGDSDVVKSGAWLGREVVQTSEDRLRQAVAGRDKLSLATQARSESREHDKGIDGAAVRCDELNGSGMPACAQGNERTRCGQGRIMCTNFRRPAQWTSSDAIGWEALQCREMQSHDDNETVNNCHATSTLYAKKNKRSCYALSLVSSCLSK